MRPRVRDEFGFTLLELMFAGGILAVGLAMLFGSLISITSVGKAAEQRQVAAGYLVTVMEQLRGSTYAQLLEYVPPTVQDLGSSAGVVVECVDEEGDLVTLPLGSEEGEEGPSADDLPNPLEVRATVIWVSIDRRATSLSSSTMFWR
jgi:type II secretory pathway pseudopilin PulG